MSLIPDTRPTIASSRRVVLAAILTVACSAIALPLAAQEGAAQESAASAPAAAAAQPATSGAQPAAESTTPASETADAAPASEAASSAAAPTSTPTTSTPTTSTPATTTPAGADPLTAAAPLSTVDPLTTADALLTTDGTLVATAGAAAPVAPERPWVAILVTILALFTVPFLLGNYLARAWRMNEYAFRIGFVIFSIAAGIVICVFGWPPKLGIDLSGGVILVYEVAEQPDAENANSTLEMDKLVAAVTRRINPAGIKEVTVRPYGGRSVEVIIPRADDVELERIKYLIRRSGALEFRIVANRRDNADVIAQAEAAPNLTRLYHTSADGKRTEIARWVLVRETEGINFQSNPNYATRTNAKGRVEALVMIDSYNVTGQYLRSASAGFDERGQPSVKFSFDLRGAQLFGELTGANLPDPQQGFERQLAIILDDEIYSAPSIKSRITDNGEITGRFTQQETTDMAAVLTAGSLPAALNPEPTTSLYTGPTLGADTIRSGVQSMLVSTVAVIIFMIVYYRFAGLVATVAVAMNVLLIVAFMILFNAAFTLSGLAGLALTVGMAVDANVLIYERIREELNRGATLRMAIRNGFDRAMSAIIDANVTTLITAVVLYAIGTDQIKGFAVTLILGLVLNLYTAITVTRLIFEVAERRRWLKQLKMMQFFGHTNFDFIGKRKLAYAFSAILIIGGLAATVVRGKGLLDIDFTGGVSVEMLFDESHPRDVAEIRQAMSSLPDVTVQNVEIRDEAPGLRFRVVTSEPEISVVESTIKKAFPGELAFNHMTVESVEAAPAAADAADAFSGGSQATLTFSDKINHMALSAAFQAVLSQEKYAATEMPFELTTPGYQPESELPFDVWTAKVALAPDEARQFFDAVVVQLANDPFFPASNTVGGTVAAATQEQAAYAFAASLLLILGYLWFRFQQVAFGFAAILAVVHDVLVALGALAVSYWLADALGFLLVEPFKINLPIIAAFLTIIGYSLNDTIVICDRIRELRGKSPRLTADLINRALNQTLSRTILTSLTVFVVVLILYVWGGQGIHGFAYTLVVGTLSGTYSTIYVSSPVLLWLNPTSDATAATSPSGEPGGRGSSKGLSKPAA